MARGVGAVAVVQTGNNRSPRIDEVLPVYRFPDEVWTTCRFFPARQDAVDLASAQHWVEIWNNEGKKVKFSLACLGLDLEQGKVVKENCVYCQELGDAPRVEYYYEVIIRDIQQNEPARQSAWTESETATWLKDKNSRSWSPVKLVRLTANMVEKLQNFAKLKGATCDDIAKGFDVSIYYNSRAKAAGDKYQMTPGDVTPLTEHEWNYEFGMCAYLTTDLAPAYALTPESWDSATQNIQRILPNLVGNEGSGEEGSDSEGAGEYAGTTSSVQNLGDDDEFATPPPAKGSKGALPLKGAKGGAAAQAQPAKGAKGAVAAPAMKGAKGAAATTPPWQDDMDEDIPASPPAKGGKGAAQPQPAMKGMKGAPAQAQVAQPAMKGAKGAAAQPQPAMKGGKGVIAAPQPAMKGAKGTRSLASLDE